MDVHTLDELLHRLTDDVQTAEYGNRHDDARASFRYGRATVPDEHEFEIAIARYYQHHQRATRGKDVEYDEALFEAEEILDRAFYREHGIDGAKREGIVGSVRGGMSYVFSCIAEHLRERHGMAYRRTVVGEYFSLSAFDQSEDCRRTLEAKLGSLWPEMPEKMRVELTLEIQKVLESAAKLPEYIRNPGRRR